MVPVEAPVTCVQYEGCLRAPRGFLAPSLRLAVGVELGVEDHMFAQSCYAFTLFVHASDTRQTVSDAQDEEGKGRRLNFFHKFLLPHFQLHELLPTP